MGILNVTPDSFSDGGEFLDRGRAVTRARELHEHGAHIVDIGGESTRPGSVPIPVELEISRVLEVVRAVASTGIAVSVDTMHAATARMALEAGASIINDVSGGLCDSDMFRTVAAYDCQYVLGHIRGTPQTMVGDAHYDDVVSDVVSDLRIRIAEAADAGLNPEAIVIDPGFGFAKTPAQSWELVAGIERFGDLDSPLMVGVSRKGFLSDRLASASSSLRDRDHVSATLSAELAARGANAVRVHEVEATRELLGT